MAAARFWYVRLPPMRRRVAFALVVSCLLACGGSKPPVDDPAGRVGMSVEIATLEISGTSRDRFVECPPEGDLGQGWIPEKASEGSHDPSVTERVINETLQPFRSCYHRGLVHDPAQDGRVAVVVHVGSAGKVESVDTYGACRLSSDVLDCMSDVARKLHFDPPAGGSNTVVIPAVFVPRSGYRSNAPTENSSYTAAVYVALEAARPALHACEQGARRAVQVPVAQGTFAVDIDAKGKVIAQHVEPWSGNKDLLVCAGAAIEKIAFPPPGTRGSVLLRLSFNPRATTR